MKSLKILAIIILNLIFQSTLIQYFGISDVVPNTGLILLVSFALLDGERMGAILGLIIGLLQDVLFCDVIGVHTLIYFFIGYLMGKMNQKVFKDNFIVPFLFTAIATIGFHFFYDLFMYFLGIDVELIDVFEKVISIELLYNSSIAIFVYKQIARISNKPRLRFKMKKRR